MKLIFAVMLGAITALAQFTPPAGGSGAGLSGLTTVGSVPYVSAAGILSEDPTVLFWDATNNRLGIGTNAPIHPISNTGKYGGATFAGSYLDVSGDAVELAANGNISLIAASGTSVRLYSATKNLSLGDSSASGGITDGAFKLDVQRSGASGTLRAYDVTATTGTTRVDFRAGAGQVVNTLFNIMNNAGTDFLMAQATAATVRLYNSGTYGWSSTSAADSNSYDTCIGRAAAALIEITTCTVNAYRDLLLRATYYGGTGATTSANLSNFGNALMTRTGAAGSPTVGSLTACSASGQGAWTFVTDALAPVIGSTVAAGGSAKAMVWCNAAAWTVIGI
jgi:hypothetical protein